MTDPDSVTCDYGPATEIATRYADDGVPLCQNHAKEHYGADWRAVTRKLTPRVAARFAVSGNCMY